MDDKQKRALGIGAIGVGGVLAYRHLHSKSAVSTNGTLTNGLAQASSPVGSTTPYTPQAPIVVPAGESIYDPNSEDLLNTTATPAPQAVTPSGPAYVVNITTPKAVATKSNKKKAATRKVTKKPAKKKKVKVVSK